jgi:hypothetical protein
MNDIEKLDKMRGHKFLPSAKVMATWPKLYQTDGVPLDQKVVRAHWFAGPCDWYAFEVDPTELLAFGWVNLGDHQNAEMGYFDLKDLGTLLVRQRFHIGETIKTIGLPVERDLDWTPTRFGNLLLR